jgi:hypothetical protein
VIQAYIDFIVVPLAAKDGFKKPDVASSEASSSSWSSASSRKFGVPFFQGESGERRLRLPAARITGICYKDLFVIVFLSGLFL